MPQRWDIRQRQRLDRQPLQCSTAHQIVSTIWSGVMKTLFRLLECLQSCANSRAETCGHQTTVYSVRCDKTTPEKVGLSGKLPSFPIVLTRAVLLKCHLICSRGCVKKHAGHSLLTQLLTNQPQLPAEGANVLKLPYRLRAESQSTSVHPYRTTRIAHMLGSIS